MYMVNFYTAMLPLKSIAHSNAEFCMLLFYNITSNKELVATDSEIKDHKCKPKYESYIRTQQCRAINTIANKICSYISPKEFENFLNENAHYPIIKKELLNNFKSRYKDRKITDDNLFSQISDIWAKIILDAAKEFKENREKAIKNKSKRNTQTKSFLESYEISNAEETQDIDIGNNNDNNTVNQEPEEHNKNIPVKCNSIVANATKSERNNPKMPDISSEDVNTVPVSHNSEEQNESEINNFEMNNATVVNTAEPNDFNPNENNHSVGVYSIGRIYNELSKIPCSKLSEINDYILKLISLIDVLLLSGEELAKEVNKNSISTLYKNCSNWNPIHENYEQYKKENAKLHVLLDRYKYEVFEQVRQFKKPFTFDSFWRCNPMIRTRSLDTRGKIDEYKQILNDISIAIDKCKE